jgi:murein DD-endopeptidase MepM/ murein hydrolase activator NlpD
MIRKGTKKTHAVAIVGWLLALVCCVAAVLYMNRMADGEMSIVLYVDGEAVCRVEDRKVVDEALLLLSDKLAADGIKDDAARETELRYVLNCTAEPLSAEDCTELLYERTLKEYSRAYMISVEGKDVAACATYAEAEQVLEDFRSYIVGLVTESQTGSGLVELTTEFEIRSIVCRRDHIASADDIYRLMVGGKDTMLPDGSEELSDSRVNAGGSQSLLQPDKNKDFGLIKNPAGGTGLKDDFSFNMSGLNSAIEYNTVFTETYTEILPFDVIYVDSDELYVGETDVAFGGENGVCENVYEVTYSGGVEVSRKLISSTVITKPKTRIERIGTKSYPSTQPTGTFIWPLAMGTFRITSQYGLQREGFETAGQKHLGVDIGGPKQGEPVIAADGGVVIFAGTKGSYGQLVKIRHEDGVETYYAHMSKIVVEVGERVYQGQKIGEIGRTGTATGVHVHFEVRINGSTVNPVNYLPKLK